MPARLPRTGCHHSTSTVKSRVKMLQLSARMQKWT
jgi:hypothetical protein